MQFDTNPCKKCAEQNVKELAHYAYIYMGWKQINEINLEGSTSPLAQQPEASKNEVGLVRAQSQAILHLKHTIVHNFTPCENDPSPPMSSQPIPQHQTNYYEGFAVLVKKKTVLPE